MHIAIATIISVVALVLLRFVAGRAKAIKFSIPTYNGTFYGAIGGWYIPAAAVVAWYQAGVHSVGWLVVIYFGLMTAGWLLGPSPVSVRNN
jgi:hypothetical protein